VPPTNPHRLRPLVDEVQHQPFSPTLFSFSFSHPRPPNLRALSSFSLFSSTFYLVFVIVIARIFETIVDFPQRLASGRRVLSRATFFLSIRPAVLPPPLPQGTFAELFFLFFLPSADLAPPLLSEDPRAERRSSLPTAPRAHHQEGPPQRSTLSHFFSHS